MGNDLVFLRGGEAFTDSLLISKKLEMQHRHVIVNIEKITRDLSHLKSSSIFEKKSKVNNRQREYFVYELNKPAFSLLMMRLKSKRVFEFQNAFNEQFYAMEKFIMEKQSASWIEAREQGKIGRREETDVLKEFVAYAEKQGNTKASFYYSSVTRMTYKALEMVDMNKDTPIREILNSFGLGALMMAEAMVTRYIQEGMEKDMHYKEVYHYAKTNLMEWAKYIPKKDEFKITNTKSIS